MQLRTDDFHYLEFAGTELVALKGNAWNNLAGTRELESYTPGVFECIYFALLT